MGLELKRKKPEEAQAAPPKAKSGSKTAPSRTPQVPRTVLNFIEEELNTKAETRRTMMTTTSFVAAACLLIGGAGFLFSSQTKAAKKDAISQGEKANAAQAEISQAVSQASGGVVDPSVDLNDHLETRRAQISSALSVDTDGSILLQTLLSASPAGLVITSVDIAGPVTMETPAYTPPAEGEKPKVTTITQITRQITIEASAPSYQAALEWQGKLQSLGLFQELVVAPSSGGTGSIGVKATAKLAEGAAQTRKNRVIAEIGQVVAPTQDPGTTTTTLPNQGGS